MADSSETESEEETRVDSFRDLLNGNIDIIEYLNSEPGSVSVSDNAFEEDFRLINLRMDGNMNMNGQNHGLPLLHPVIGGGLQNVHPTLVFRPQVRSPPYEQAVRLPDSPPETDSTAGSAGSPSGSETSPCSPEFQHFPHPGHMRGSVIHAPVGGGPASHLQQLGVILNVTGLDNFTQMIINDYILPVQTNAWVYNSHIYEHMTSPEFYPNQATPGVQQSSPTGTYTPYVLPPPSVHNSFSNDGGSLPRKRPRNENNQFVKPEPNLLMAMRNFFECSICWDLMERPKLCTVCQCLVACSTCLTTWHETDSRCPKCRGNSAQDIEVKGPWDQAVKALRNL